jgi:transposase
MLGDISRISKLYLVTGYTDMRKQLAGLRAIIRDTYKMDPYENALFLFCGRKADRLKALYFDKLSADFCYPHIFLPGYDI